MKEPEVSIDSQKVTSELAVQYRVLNKEDAIRIMAVHSNPQPA
jgi:hypothetical protein